MADLRTIQERSVTSIGCVCLVAALLLLSLGVRAVRADETVAPAPMSPDPVRVDRDIPEAEGGLPAETAAAAREASSTTPPAAPRAIARDPETRRPTDASGAEADEGVIVLNTRGYNYGPPQPSPPALSPLDPNAPPTDGTLK
jgi:hypothetical protein